MGRYTHFSIDEREDLASMLREGRSRAEIAGELGRSRSSVSREIERNSYTCGSGRCYRAHTAQARSEARRARCRRGTRLMDDPERAAVVAEKVRDERWSPEQVEARIALERPELAVSDSTIYRAVESGELDCELPGRARMASRLRRRGKARKRRGSEERRGRIEVTHALSERPPEAEARERLGDWEGDTVAGSRRGPCLVTLVDRRSGLLVGGKARGKRAAQVRAVIERSLAPVPAESLTLDNGKEFAGAGELQRGIGAPVYFCSPHHPWERGTNENTNGLLRDFFPKGRSLSGVRAEEVSRVYRLLNTRPRKRLGWLCPEEVFYHKRLHLI